MALHETMKNAKIVEEIFANLLEKGVHKIDLGLEIKETETTFTLLLDYDEKIAKSFKEDLHCFRESELEEYGWELAGEDEDCSGLDMLGMLIDSFEAERIDDKIKIIFHRKND